MIINEIVITAKINSPTYAIPFGLDTFIFNKNNTLDTNIINV